MKILKVQPPTSSRIRAAKKIFGPRSYYPRLEVSVNQAIGKYKLSAKASESENFSHILSLELVHTQI